MGYTCVDNQSSAFYNEFVELLLGRRLALGHRQRRNAPIRDTVRCPGIRYL